MNPTEPRKEAELEAMLRRAPSPRPPEALEATLLKGIRLEATPESRNGAVNPRRNGDTRRGWRRWWPMVLPAAAAAAFATTAVVQEFEINDLQAGIRQFEHQRRAVQESDPSSAAPPSLTTTSVPNDRDEIARLRELVDRLLAEVAAVDALRAENEQLKAAIAAALKKVPAEMQEMAAASEKAKRIQCVNNMKLLGLAVRIFATDNNDQFPPDILSITNELGTPKVLVCPADDLRHPAENWSSYTAANCSYEFLSPGPGAFESDPERVMFKCPYHGNVTLCDGSVQQMDLVKNPDRLVSRNGGLYMNSVAAAPPQAGTPGVAPTGMNPELARRYGLIPADGAPGASAPGQVSVENSRSIIGVTVITTNDAGVVTVDVRGPESNPQPEPHP